MWQIVGPNGVTNTTGGVAVPLPEAPVPPDTAPRHAGVGATVQTAAQTTVPVSYTHLEARKYLQMAHMECELMGPVRSDARLCGDILEGLGIRRVHRRNARVLGDVAEMVERACGIGGR